MNTYSRMNFANLAFGDLNTQIRSPRSFTQVMIDSGDISNVDNCGMNNVDSDSTTSRADKIIIVSNMLPLHAQKDGETESWSFSYDEDSLLWQLKDGFSPETVVFYVGSLNANVDAKEHEEIAKKLLDDFNCVPTFLTDDLIEKFYHGFCKHHLWPIFHYMLPMCESHCERYDQLLWLAYISANRIFADKVLEVANLEDDFIWIHDYHLMAVPVFLRKSHYRANLGFFLHSPFPALDIYRTLPVSKDILRSLLNCDIIGFHTFDYARHFLSCCSRMLGLGHEFKRGHIVLDYCGRTVCIKILAVGIHLGKIQTVLNLPSTSTKVKEIKEQFSGKQLILGVDDMDLFKGISLKFLAFEQLLKKFEHLRDLLVLVQIINPARSSGKDIQEVKRETYETANRINQIYGSPGHDPVILIDRLVGLCEKSAYYAASECCIVNAVRDGMNLVPYEYTVCRQGSEIIDEARGIKSDSPRTSMLLVSEFIGCSPSLSGAIRINPWDIDSVEKAMRSAIIMNDSLRQMRHEKNYQYVRSHDVTYWARSFVQSMKRACNHDGQRCWGMGLGLSFKVVALSEGFRKLFSKSIIRAYNRTNRRAIFLDFDGTLVPHFSTNKNPSCEVISALNTLCDDPKNTVFIVSGRGRSSLDEWLAPCEGLGLAAEHGYFIRWTKTSDWQSNVAVDLEWKRVVEHIMRMYTEATDGSNIEIKESALVWHYQDADPDFGSWQANELVDHLKHVIAKEPAVVRRGKDIVEVKPQGISKGLVTEKVISKMIGSGETPDFILCIGDDRSDEDMYESILKIVSSAVIPAVPDIFFCTIGQKPSKARYFLDDTSEVQELLQWLAESSLGYR
ncbi:putative alpha,alpha-trehalose-phosphate synthase [UDP-forming] 9 [Heracleum sosnowskyi]|uniref:Alpha,alpha-trehalose-phosphate synthase [UDP-forming] 9 n=1 Tax=Heracleum sosnowskyi TaxID=360622 RepID=A0AAD8M4V5_9APIA|nr:putative alpha,alpha-trehalose-phosphate synthase [UDP-forming] 9 [Heracleum sosnowskyi]